MSVLSLCLRVRPGSPSGIAVRVRGRGPVRPAEGGRGREFECLEGHLVDALAPRGDEGRGTLRKAAGSCEQALIRGCPNGETRPLWVIPG